MLDAMLDTLSMDVPLPLWAVFILVSFFAYNRLKGLQWRASVSRLVLEIIAIQEMHVPEAEAKMARAIVAKAIQDRRNGARGSK